MHIQTDPLALQQEALHRRAAGARIGLVPTMGYLHRGHTSLMDILRPRCDWLVASVYVNPLQFGPTEDLARYPRDPEGDADQCRRAGVDCLLMPSGSLYPSGHRTQVQVSTLTDGLCGAARPGHFRGVTTVVSRLLLLSQATIAIFGEKDYQQLTVIRRMVTDLAIPTEILGGPLVRDDDGVALSSRNRYLTPDDRHRARSLHRALFAIRDQAAAAHTTEVSDLLAHAHDLLDVDQLDYLEVVDAQTLQPLRHLAPGVPARALVGATIGRTRLIDNVEVIAP